VSDDKYATARNLPLLGVLSALGSTDWKPRKSGREWAGKCPVHQPKKNTSSFSFDVEGKYQCFSCSTKGKGAIDIVMAIKQIGFRDAVALLETLNVPESPSGQAQNHFGDANDMVTENPPFAGTYEKYAVPSPWLEARGLLPETLKRFEVFQYDNPKRKSQYTGSVMLKIRRWRTNSVASCACSGLKPRSRCIAAWWSYRLRRPKSTGGPLGRSESAAGPGPSPAS